MAEAASFLEFLLQVYVQWSKDLQRDGWHQAGTTSITGLPRGVLSDYRIILPPLVLLYDSSACITGYFCSTAWSNGTGLSFRQCITLLQINIRREMKLSWAFVCGPCSLCQLSEQGVGALIRRGFGCEWHQKPEKPILWVFRAPGQNLWVCKWRATAGKACKCLDGKHSPHKSTVDCLEEKAVKILCSVLYFIASFAKLLVQGSCGVSRPSKETLMLHWDPIKYFLLEGKKVALTSLFFSYFYCIRAPVLKQHCLFLMFFLCSCCSCYTGGNQYSSETFSEAVLTSSACNLLD